MKIIDDLARGAIQVHKKDTFATKVTIFLSVVLLGTIIFIFSNIRQMEYKNTLEVFGDYQVSISGITEEMAETISGHEEIDKISYSETIRLDEKTNLIKKEADLYSTFTIDKGRKPVRNGECVVTEKYLKKHPKLKIGSKLNLKGEAYTIVGEYNDRSYSFEEDIILACVDKFTSKELFQSNGAVEAYLWYKNPRDTYPLTREILQELEINEAQEIDRGRLYYNVDYLEHKLIYPKGLIPPKHVIEKLMEKYGVLIFLSVLFSTMVYGAFNVWNERDRRELALLKSVGMTQRQIKKFVRRKIYKLSLTLIIFGMITSYFTAYLLIYLMWLNNKISYDKIGTILQNDVRTYKFLGVPLSVTSFVTIAVLAFLIIYLSAMRPARRSAKISIVDGIRGIQETTGKLSKSRIRGPVETSLSKDYYHVYRSTYRVTLIGFLIASMIISTLLISNAYSGLKAKYDQFQDPYSLQASIFTDRALDQNISRELIRLQGVESPHLYQTQSFKFYLADNPEFLSKEAAQSLKDGVKAEDRLYVQMIGLSNEDFQEIKKVHKLDEKINSVLLNRTPENGQSAYVFWEFIPWTEKDKDILKIRYSEDGKTMDVPFAGWIEEFPYDLEGYSNQGLILVTTMDEMNQFYKTYGMDPGYPVQNYTIKYRDAKDLGKSTREVEDILLEHYPSSDISINNDILDDAIEQEENRNVRMLNLGIQLILFMIALSNAYNSFHSNIIARSQEFNLLNTVGMTKNQIKKMLYGEGGQLMLHTFIFGLLFFIIAVIIRSIRGNLATGFTIRALLIRINYLPLLVNFLVMGLGVALSVWSGIRTLSNEGEFN